MKFKDKLENFCLDAWTVIKWIALFAFLYYIAVSAFTGMGFTINRMDLP